MTVRNGLFSSESVSEGHPDKLADRISDAVLDEFLRLDPNARVACETLLADQCVVVAGEFKTRIPEDLPARCVSVRCRSWPACCATPAIATAPPASTPERCEVQVRFNGQSADINHGVDRADGVIGAGDQGLMFGYACDETPELMPAPIVYAHRLVRRQAELRRTACSAWLRPDAKSQVTFRYEDGRPVAIEAVVLSTQHAEDIDTDDAARGGEPRDHRRRHPRAAAGQRLSRADQPDRPLRHRRPEGRHRADGAQDHRRHLRWRGAPRRRRLLGQGPVQGGPIGRVHGAIPGQAGRGAGLGDLGAWCSWPTRSAWPNR